MPAVVDLSMHVASGSVTALVGANGAGKTTTLGAIASTRTVSAGDIQFEGRSLVGQPPERIVRAGIALVPENRRIFSSLLVSENLSLGLAAGRLRSDERDLVEEALDRFPVLRDRANKPAGTLSGGEQQQLAIARALITRPRLLMLDEPSLGLAPRVIDLVFSILEELRSEGQTILLVEQNVRRTLRFADYSYVLGGGRVSLHGSRDEIASVSPPEIERAFFGDHTTVVAARTEVGP